VRQATPGRPCWSGCYLAGWPIARLEALADLAIDAESTPALGSAGAPIAEIAGPHEEDLVDMAIRRAARYKRALQGLTDGSRRNCRPRAAAPEVQQAVPAAVVGGKE
jgi:hypothetical protein